MNIFEAILKRKIAVKFEKKEIDDKLIGLILHSATHAPSAGDIQEWRFIVVKDDNLKEKISELSYDEKILKEAPVCIVVCADIEAISTKYGEKGKKYAIQDTSFASMIIILCSYALGLSSTLIRNFKSDEIKKLLDLPEYLEPMTIIPIGYPAEEREIDRIPYENLTSLNLYGRKYEVELKPLIEYLKDFLEKKRIRKSLGRKS